MNRNLQELASRADDSATTARSEAVMLLPIIAVVFIAYLVIGLAMPVLPLHVHHGLGLSTFVVGLVSGSQFGAALISRVDEGTPVAISKWEGIWLMNVHFRSPLLVAGL
jgi:hypothetical protein